MIDYLEEVTKHCNALFDTGEFDFIKEKLSDEELWRLLFFVSYIYEAVKREEK